MVPVEVHAELSSGKRPVAVRNFASSLPEWMSVRAATSPIAIPGLHAGEAAAIALASEHQADRLVIDEAVGRKVAAERGLQVIGTIGILEAAAQRQLVDLQVAFDLVKATDFWVSPKFLVERLGLFREWQRSQNGAVKGVRPPSEVRLRLRKPVPRTPERTSEVEAGLRKLALGDDPTPWR